MKMRNYQYNDWQKYRHRKLKVNSIPTLLLLEGGVPVGGGGR